MGVQHNPDVLQISKLLQQLPQLFLFGIERQVSTRKQRMAPSHTSRHPGGRRGRPGLPGTVLGLLPSVAAGLGGKGSGALIGRSNEAP